MKRTWLVFAGMLLSSSMLMAQQPGSSSGAVAKDSSIQPPNRLTYVITAPDGQPCPVGLQAKQGFGQGLVKVRHAPDVSPEDLSKPGQRIHLIVTNPGESQSTMKIVGATITARGLTARGRLEKASGASGTADVRRTLNVRFAAENGGSVSADLLLPGFTAVKSVKIEALEYADGSTRDLAGQKLCTVTPDPLMLVAEGLARVR